MSSSEAVNTKLILFDKIQPIVGRQFQERLTLRNRVSLFTARAFDDVFRGDMRG